jgi:thiamine biosynthesis lipoprotein
MKRAKFLRLLPLLAVAAVAFCNSSCGGEEAVTKSSFVMGTRVTVSIYGVEEKKAEEIAGEAIHELHRLEQIMSTWNPESEISRLNSSAGKERISLSPEIMDLLDISIQFSKLTSGAFDITARPVSRLWGFQDGADTIPSQESISEAMAAVGYEKIDINRSGVLLPAGTQIDLAGIAKGYGVDRCADIIRDAGVSSALIDLGGNIYALGSPPGKKGWIVGIRNPVKTDSIIGYVILRDEAAASSGNYENYVERNGERFGHIIDPRTGRPASGPVRGVTVIAPTAAAADALSTSLFVLGAERGIALCRRISVAHPPDSLPYLAGTAEQGYLRRTGNYADAVFITLEDRFVRYHRTGSLGGKLFLEDIGGGD